MTTWSYFGAGARQSSAGASTLTPVVPSGSSSLTNGLLIAIAASKSNGDITTSTSGWTRRSYVTRGAALSAAWFTAPAGSANPVINGTTLVLAQVVAIDHPNRIIDTSPIGTIVSNNGGATPHSVNGYNTTRDDVLACYLGVGAANASYITPSGWTEHLDVGSATGNSRNVFGFKTMGASSSPTGNISVNGPNADWIMWQFEVLLVDLPDGATIPVLETVPFLGVNAGTTIPVVETVPWVRTAQGTEVPLLEVVPWMRTPEGTEVPLLEVVAWIEPGANIISTARRRPLYTN